jgi:hypothetical protein
MRTAMAVGGDKVVWNADLLFVLPRRVWHIKISMRRLSASDTPACCRSTRGCVARWAMLPRHDQGTSRSCFRLRPPFCPPNSDHILLCSVNCILYNTTFLELPPPSSRITSTAGPRSGSSCSNSIAIVSSVRAGRVAGLY